MHAKNKVKQKMPCFIILNSTAQWKKAVATIQHTYRVRLYIVRSGCIELQSSKPPMYVLLYSTTLMKTLKWLFIVRFFRFYPENTISNICESWLHHILF